MAVEPCFQIRQPVVAVPKWNFQLHWTQEIYISRVLRYFACIKKNREKRKEQLKYGHASRLWQCGQPTTPEKSNKPLKLVNGKLNTTFYTTIRIICAYSVIISDYSIANSINLYLFGLDDILIPVVYL